MKSPMFFFLSAMSDISRSRPERWEVEGDGKGCVHSEPPGYSVIDDS